MPFVNKVNTGALHDAAFRFSFRVPDARCARWLDGLLPGLPLEREHVASHSMKLTATVLQMK